MVARVKANTEDILIHFTQQTLQLGLKVDESSSMSVNANGKTVFFSAHFSDGGDTIAKSSPFSRVHLFGFCGTSCGRRATWGDAVDDHKPCCPMGCKGFAGTD